MIKFLALDVDGVLNTGTEYDLDLKLIRNLKTIIDRTGANIILTSSWKEAPFLSELLRLGLDIYHLHIYAISEDKVYDRFTSLFKKLDNDFKHYQCVVLDDEKFDYDNLTEKQKQCFVFTNMSEGLTREKANEVIEKFKMYNFQEMIVDLMKEGYDLKEIISQVSQVYTNALPLVASESIEYHIGDKFFIEPYLHASPQVDETDAYGIYEIIEKIADDLFLARHQETGEIFATSGETITYLSTGLIYKEIYVGTWRHEDKEYRFINI